MPSHTKLCVEMCAMWPQWVFPRVIYHGAASVSELRRALGIHDVGDGSSGSDSDGQSSGEADAAPAPKAKAKPRSKRTAAAKKTPAPPGSVPLRQVRGTKWGPWPIAAIRREATDGTLCHVGWRGTCRCHHNSWDKASDVCRKELFFQESGMCPQEALRRIKGWLVAGQSIAEDDLSGRMDHGLIHPTELPLLTDAQLDEQLPDM